jgi:hypothetical protein
MDAPGRDVTLSATVLRQHLGGRLAFGGADGVGGCGARLHHQAVAVLNEDMAHVAKLRSVAYCLLVEWHTGIGG